MTRRNAFLAGLLLELVAIFAIFVPYVYHMQTSEVITLRTIPVDPYSMFRGSYVQLNYDIGANSSLYEADERPVYVVLTGSGNVSVRKSVSDTLPKLQPGESCIKGVQSYNMIRFPQISQYFADEATAKELEQARNAHRMFVDVAVKDNCKAVIRGITLGPEVPQEEFGTQWRVPDFETKPMPAPVTGSGA